MVHVSLDSPFLILPSVFSEKKSITKFLSCYDIPELVPPIMIPLNAANKDAIEPRVPVG